MRKGKREDTNNDGRDGSPSIEETREDRMRMFDQLPKALRQFLSLDAPYDFAVTQFWATRGRGWDRARLVSASQRAVMQETAERYGVDHPQAVAFTSLRLKSGRSQKTRVVRRVAVPRSYR